MTGRGQYFIEGLLVALFFTALTLPMYYPISVHPGSLLTGRGDPCLFAWMLSWYFHKLATGLNGFFNANIFWPHLDGLAYTDYIIGSALLVAPVYLPTKNPVLAWNAIGISSFILSGLGMYLLARGKVLSRSAALIAGIIFAYCPWRFAQLGHPFIAGQWMPISLLFLHRTLDNPRWRDALLFGLFFTLQALCSFNLAILLAAAAATVFISELVARKFRAPAGVWVRLAVVGVISLAVIAPTIIPYYRVSKEQGLKRSERECIYWSADPLDYLAAPPCNRLYKNTHRIFRSRAPFAEGVEKWLFPGVLAVVLALAGMIRLPARSARDDPSPRRLQLRLRIKWEHTQGIYLILAITAFILSLGPELHLFWKPTPIPLPYKLFYNLIPGFQGFRGPSRFAYLLMLAVAILAAYGYRNIEGRVKSSLGRYALLALLAGGIIAEYFSSPVPHLSMPVGEKIPQVYKWLARKPADTVITELPQYPGWSDAPKGLSDPLGFTYMYYSTFHHLQPMTNGQSSFDPPGQRFIWDIMMTFPSPQAINLARYLGVKYIVLHTAAYPGDEGKAAAEQADALSSELKAEGSFGPDRVYQVLNLAPPGIRGKLEGLKITDASLPRRVMSKSKTDFSFELTNTGPWPAMSFKLVEVKARINETGPAGSRSLESSDKEHIKLLPGQSKWFNLGYECPSKDGIYQSNIQVIFPEFPQINRSFSFRFEAGNFPDSRHPGILKAEFFNVSAPSVLRAGEKFIIKARVKNTGDTLWRAGGPAKGKVRLGIKGWHTSDKKPLSPQPRIERESLDRAVSPQEETGLLLKAWAPETPGQYLIQLDMVDEHICWFADQGSTPVWIPVEVKSW